MSRNPFVDFGLYPGHGTASERDLRRKRPLRDAKINRRTRKPRPLLHCGKPKHEGGHVLLPPGSYVDGFKVLFLSHELRSVDRVCVAGRGCWFGVPENALDHREVHVVGSKESCERVPQVPAAEVGGDFYHVVTLSDGSSLLILGDVSGKGLKAAMTGALAIGSFRTLAAQALSPATVLSRLNESLYRAGDGGFITCLCGQLWPGGRLILANAGHLSPYHNGDEVHLESGLPLGIVSTLQFAETTIELKRGDMVVMLTDGVVEVQSRSGELFGFERTRNISIQLATQIAAAAQAFGQSDDITVLCITSYTEAKTPPEVVPLASSVLNTSPTW